MLPHQPLRFLLADDPGATKMIMAGLLMKELNARGISTDAWSPGDTGYAQEHWVGANAGMNEMQSENPVPCREIAGFVARIGPPASKPTPVWGVELVGGPTDETALAAYRRLEQKYASILSGRQTYVVHHGLGRGSMGWAHVHVGHRHAARIGRCIDVAT